MRMELENLEEMPPIQVKHDSVKKTVADVKNGSKIMPNRMQTSLYTRFKKHEGDHLSNIESQGG
jgi:hypothetical protein